MAARSHFALAAALAGVVLFGFPDAVASQEDAPLPAVVVKPAEMVDLQSSVGFSGRVVSQQQVDILARVSGFIEERPFVEGAAVEMGEPLYMIEDDAYRASLSESEGQIKSAESELRLAEIERDRKTTLVDRDAVAQSELDIALAQLGMIEGELIRLNAQRDRAELDLSYTTVRAPFDGVIGLTNAHVGDLVGLDSGPLATLTLLDPIYVEFPVATRLLLGIQQERSAEGEEPRVLARLVLANGQEYPIDGTLDFLDVSVSSGTDTVIVRAEFENSDHILLANSLVTVRLVESEPTPELAVPQQAVQRDMAGAFVMVVGADGVVEQRRIETERTVDGYAVIISGLEVGENVITEGVNKVRPGIEVDAAMTGG